MAQSDIHDVAKAAGVSISTVSRAFTRPELVSDKTRRKVLQAADQLDYNISRSAGALKMGQTYRVALLMNEGITSWFNAATLAGIESVMHPAGYDISLFQHIDTAETRRAFFTELPIRRNVDAVFVASFAIDPYEVEQLGRANVPIIGINTPSFEGFDASISIDDEEGMFRATQHLISLGHRHIVYVCSASETSMNASIDARGRGFVRACKASAPPARSRLAGAHRAARSRIHRCGAGGAHRPRPVPGRDMLPDGHARHPPDHAAAALRPLHAEGLFDHRVRRQHLCQ